MDGGAVVSATGPARLPAGATATEAALAERLDRIAAQLAEVAEETRRARERWEVLDELLHDATPVMRQTLGSVTERLDALDRRGYTEFLGAGVGVVDRIVGAFGREDVEALGDNVVLMLQTLREMTQPEVLGLLRQTAAWAHAHPAAAEPPTLLSLAGRLRRPDVRAGLDRVLGLLEGVAAATPAASAPPPKNPVTTQEGTA